MTFKYSGRIVNNDTVWLSFLSNAKAKKIILSSSRCQSHDKDFLSFFLIVL